jgi:hypothetical protein
MVSRSRGAAAPASRNFTDRTRLEYPGDNQSRGRRAAFKKWSGLIDKVGREPLTP